MLLLLHLLHCRGSSLDVTPAQFCSLLDGMPLRLISIDGGHTAGTVSVDAEGQQAILIFAGTASGRLTARSDPLMSQFTAREACLLPKRSHSMVRGARFTQQNFGPCFEDANVMRMEAGCCLFRRHCMLDNAGVLNWRVRL
jgi:hypothetical protein